MGTSILTPSANDIATANIDEMHRYIIDLFGRVKVSQPETLFDSKLLYDKDPLFWSEATFAGGSSVFSTGEASVVMSTSASGDGVIRQTKMRFGYQPGKAQTIMMTAVLATEANVRKRLGYFSSTNVANSVPENGIYLENNGGTISWNIAKGSAVTETVAQSAWNFDKLDGTGVSGLTLDLSLAQILAISFEYLGVGTVSVGFFIDGRLRICHNFLHANVTSAVYMATPNLPVNYQIYQSGGGTGSFRQICCTVISDGGQQELGRTRSFNIGATSQVNANTIGTFYALCGLRLKTTSMDAIVKILSFNAIAITPDNFLLSLRLNPTVAGTPAWTDVADDFVQQGLPDLVGNPSATTITGGTVIASHYQNSANSVAVGIDNTIRLGSTIAGVRDEIWVCVSPLGANLDIFGSLTWRTS